MLALARGCSFESSAQPGSDSEAVGVAVAGQAVGILTGGSIILVATARRTGLRLTLPVSCDPVRGNQGARRQRPLRGSRCAERGSQGRCGRE